MPQEETMNSEYAEELVEVVIRALQYLVDTSKKARKVDHPIVIGTGKAIVPEK